MAESIDLQDLPNGIISPTSYGMYLRCPFQYYLRYVQGLKEPPASPLIRGIAAHTALDGHFKAILKLDHRPSTEDLCAHYEQALVWTEEERKQATQQEIVWKKDDSHATLLDRGVEVLRQYDREHGQKIVPARVEDPFRLEFKDVEWALEGRVDLQQRDTLTVQDFKTASRKYDESAVLTSDALTLYQEGIEAQPGEQQIGDLQIHVLLFYKDKVDVQILKAKRRKPAVRKATLENVGSTVRGIRAQVFPKTGNIKMTCSWCGYRRRCRPEYDKWMREKDDE